MSLPEMNQTHFIAMWKTFYDIFVQHKNEQELYHAVVKVGTLLTSLGDAGKVIRSPCKTKQESSSSKQKPEDAIDCATEAPGSMAARKQSLTLPVGSYQRSGGQSGATGDSVEVTIYS